MRRIPLRGTTEKSKIANAKTVAAIERLARANRLHAATVDEWIEHQVEEFVGELECNSFGPGRGLSRKLRKRVDQIVTAQSEQRHKGRRQRTTVVEEVIDRNRDIALIDRERRGWRCRWVWWNWRDYLVDFAPRLFR